MFQYAAGHALAHRLGVDLWLHPVETRPEHARFALEIFERSLKIWEPSNGSSGLFKPFTRPKKGKKAVSAWRGPVFEQSQFCSTEGFEDIKPGSYVIGYFQSERFFVEQAQSIRDFFDIARITDNALRDHLDAANKPDSVAIHIRRGDYATDPKTRATHGLLQDEYYQRAMKLMERLQNVRAWLIFSDDPNAAAELTSNWPQRTIITGNSAIQDMALMSTCSHHIIANSSFSWWGAWLCSNPDKTIIAPRRWLSETEMQRRYVDGVYPEGWLLI